MRRKHLKHQTLARARRSSFAQFLSDEATRLSVPIRAIRDLIRTLGTKSGDEIHAAADAAAAGILKISGINQGYVRRVPAATPDVAFGLSQLVESSVNFKVGATSTAATVAFTAVSKTITRVGGSFVTDGFKVGGVITIDGSTGNDGRYTLTTVNALTMIVTESLVDHAAEAADILQVNSIVDTDGGNFASRGIVNGQAFTIDGSSGYDGTYTCATVSTSLILVDVSVSPPTHDLVPGTDSGIVGDDTQGVTMGQLAVTPGNLTFFPSLTVPTITRASGNFTTDGFVAGATVVVTGTSHNDGRYKIAPGGVASTVLTLVAGSVLKAEVKTGDVRQANVIKRLDGVSWATGPYIYIAGVKVRIAGVVHTVASVATVSLILEDSADLETDTSSDYPDATNVILRSAGSFVSDGYIAGEGLECTGGRANADPFHCRAITVAALYIVVDKDDILFEPFASDLSVKGNTVVTRASGSFSGDGVLVGDQLAFIGGTNTGKVVKPTVVGTTTLEVPGGDLTDHAAEGSVAIYRYAAVGR